MQRGWLPTGLLALLCLGAVACAASRDVGQSSQPLGYPPPGYPHHVGSTALEFFWRCAQPEPRLLQVEGVAVNISGGAPARFLKLELAGADVQGRYVASAIFETPAPEIWPGDSQPFRLALRTTGTEVRFDLFYEYGYEAERDVRLLAATGNTPFRLAEGLRNIVRDACSPTQHLTR